MLKKLKDFLNKRDDFMVHELAVATGCSLKEALSVGVLLWHFRVVEIYILLSRPDLAVNPIYQGKLSDGPPTLPFDSVDNDVQIDSLDDIHYDYQFVLFEDANFIIYS